MKRALPVLVAALALLGGCGRRDAQAPDSAAPASAAASVSAPASAASPVGAASGPILAPMADARPTDAQRSAGAQLASKGGGGAVAACSSCHGAQGEGNAAGGFPRIAGQSYGYLLHELQSYGDDSRQHPVMGPIAKAMTAEQRQAGAAYYASLAASAPAATAGASTPGTAAGGRGRQLATVGEQSLRLQACANCHGPDGLGQGRLFPYLAGQHAAYLQGTLAAWRDGMRRNDPSGQMPLVGKALSDQDAQAVAAYYATLPPPTRPRDVKPATAVAAAASAVVSGPRGASAAGGEQAMQGKGSEQGTPVMGGAQGPGGGGSRP
ncbi:c-type cytochrome [Azohydromonas australica]|uniref:c-type cytochrome n=1 Tax=Azohydromonas australica TaxID=364039 RepID=UPI0004179A55|nr:c-type cytochrome [Azohydromonas australica]